METTGYNVKTVTYGGVRIKDPDGITALEEYLLERVPLRPPRTDGGVDVLVIFGGGPPPETIAGEVRDALAAGVACVLVMPYFSEFLPGPGANIPKFPSLTVKPGGGSGAAN